MGPNALFDKSFLQSLSLDESVWFDHFFNANISPLFFIETLADLDKEIGRGRTAEDVVGNIAEKTPQMSGMPNVSAIQLMVANLMGESISMSNRPVVAGGRQVDVKGKRGVVFDIAPEVEAFNRWSNREYQYVEREFAKKWRAQIKSMTFEGSSQYANKLGIDISSCRSIEDAFAAAHEIVTKKDKPYELLAFICESVGLPRECELPLAARFNIAGFPSLASFAPYAAHVVKVEVFFHICVSRGLISAERPSNKIDISYLHYLPFCHVFISGDKLHRKVTPLFLNAKQKFVWGPDLKTELSRLNEYFMALPQCEKDKGVVAFASAPPLEGGYLVADLWDLLGTTWREKPPLVPITPELSDRLSKEMFAYVEAPGIASGGFLDNRDSMLIKRSIPQYRGSWLMVPRGLEGK